MFERTLNIFWVAAGVAICAYAQTLGLIGPNGPDSGFFPFAGGLVLAAGGVLLVARSTPVKVEWPRGAGLKRIVWVLVGLGLITVLMSHIGFVAAAVLTMIVLLRAIERTGWVQVLVLAVSASVFVYGLFAKLLGMPLPRGPWGF